MSEEIEGLLKINMNKVNDEPPLKIHKLHEAADPDLRITPVSRQNPN